MADAGAEVRCPHCGMAVEAWWPICGHCGYDLRYRPGWADEPKLAPPTSPADATSRRQPWFEWWRIRRWLIGWGSNPSR